MRRFIIESSKEKRTLVAVHKSTHEALKAFAASRGTSMVDATQYLIEKALKDEYTEDKEED